MGEQHQICTFLLRDMLFGMNVDDVQEVIRYQEMTPVPLAPGVVRGLINLRGSIVTAIDLRKRMQLGGYGPSEEPMNVVVRMEDEELSFLVDEIGDVLVVDDDTFESPPDTLKPEVRRLLQGVYKLDGGLLLILDTRKIVRVEDNG